MQRLSNKSEDEVNKNNDEIQMAEITKIGIGEPQKPENKGSLMYMFKQQLISAWRPVPSLSSSIILYVVLATFFIAVGVVMFLFTQPLPKYEVRYDATCVSSISCNVEIEIMEDMDSPVYFYYGLTNFNQNQRFYATSKSQTQLEKGVQLGSVQQARQFCGSKTTNAEMGWTQSVSGTPLVPGAVAFPCGMIAYSFFNDTFTMVRKNDSMPINIQQTGIAWENDKKIYKNYDLSIQGIDVTNEHWMVWLRPAATNSFFKLWGSIPQKLLKQTYTITITNNYVVPFAQKWIKLSKSNVFGDNNLVLSIAYLACGALSLTILIGFIIGKIKSQFK